MVNVDRMLQTLDDYSVWMHAKWPGLAHILKNAAGVIREQQAEIARLQNLLDKSL